MKKEVNIMKKTIKYKGYTGSIEYSEKDKEPDKPFIIQNSEIKDLGFVELPEETSNKIEQMTEEAEKHIEENTLCSCANCKAKRANIKE